VTTPLPVPLSYAQERLWFLDQLHPGDPTYTMPYVCTLRGPLDIDRLRRCLDALVARHSSLRTRIRAVDGAPVATVDPPGPAAMAVLDLSGAADDVIEQAMAEHVSAPFDLAGDPMLRALLIRTGTDAYLLGLAVHHIASDGRSQAVLIRELSDRYRSRYDDAVAPPIDYATYAARQRDRLTPDVLADGLDRWERVLRGLTTLDLPADRLRAQTATNRGDHVRHRLDGDVSTGVHALARAHGVTPFLVLAAAVDVVLSRYTGQTDIAIGIPMSARREPALDDVVGLFVDMAVLRADLSGDPTFADIMDRVADAYFDAYDVGEIPFGMVVDRVRPTRDPSRNPLFQVSVQLMAATDGPDLPGVTAEPLFRHVSRSRFDLAVTFVDDGERFEAQIEYATDLYDRWRIDALAEHIETVLAGVGKDPGLRLASIPLLSDDAVAAIRSAGRGETVVIADEPVHAAVARIARADPDAIAAVCVGRTLTYRDLDRRADALAARLRDTGSGSGSVVAIAMHRSPEAIVAMVAVLRTGAAFTVLDPAHPAARLDFQLTDVAAPVVVVDADAAPPPLPPGIATIGVGTGTEDAAVVAGDDATAGGLAYVLYTSGSTGRPKGVLIDHTAFAHFIAAYRRAFGLTADDRMLQLPSMTFDIALGEIFTALSVGATLVLVAPDEAGSPAAIAELMRRERVTYAGLMPAMLAVIDPQPYPSLRYVMAGGDVLPADAVNRWNLPGRRFVNMYGPTEAAISCTEYVCHGRDRTTPPPIGRPQVNRQIYVVDRDGNPVPIGVPGELLVGGDGGLARGYLNQPELTAARFTADPYHPDRLVYRTGDLVRWTHDRQIEFLGRIDTQVKIRGLRIELGEIESVLQDLPGVGNAAVLARSGPTGERQLVGYVTPAVGAHEPDPERLGDALRERLPEYMIPTRWLVLDAFPLTSSAKVDRAALPDPEWTVHRSGRAAATDTEARLTAIMADVLGTGAVGTDANFFDLGGTSLQAMRVVSRIGDAFGVRATVRMLYGAADVAAVAAAIDRLAAA
jgi:amino acid adenylation domain-containing protein